MLFPYVQLRQRIFSKFNSFSYAFHVAGLSHLFSFRCVNEGRRMQTEMGRMEGLEVDSSKSRKKGEMNIEEQRRG